MSNSEDKVLKRLQEFSDLIRNENEEYFKVGVREEPVSEVKKEYKDPNGWKWSDDAGVYYFRNDKEILYVGRALRDTLFGSRIYSHIKSKDYKWQKDISDATIGFIVINKEQDFIAPALELYLMDRLAPDNTPPRPKYNDRRG